MHLKGAFGTIIVLNILLQCSKGQICSQIHRCSDCIRKPNCQWCANMQVLNTENYKRCSPLTNDTGWIEWCGEANAVLGHNYIEMVQDEELSDSEDGLLEVIQIKPQKVRLKLAVGKPQLLKVTFKYVEDYPLDLYYLMDLSKSMEGDKNTIESLADDLANELQKLTRHHRLGFGSFLDKVVLPFVNTDPDFLANPCKDATDTCRAPYGFQNILSLTNDTEQFMNAVRNAKISTNLDEPEGGLDGLLQSMLCRNQIGWETSKTSRHLIVYVSGSPFKYAADAKLAGITRPFDMFCHLDEYGYYTQSSIMDYPSVSQVNEASKKEKKHIIFAVKKNVLPVHEALSHLVGQSRASELQEDSSNIIDIITSFYKNISETVILEDNATLTNVDISYYSTCNGPILLETNECHDVSTDQEVEFTLKFELKQCPSNPKSSLRIRVSPQLLKDEILIDVEPFCSCECENEKNIIIDAKQCHTKGSYQCGACECQEGYSGQHCECKDFSLDDSTTQRDNCRSHNDTSGIDCNGHGSCKCGECVCRQGVTGRPHWHYEGTYCECSNFDCPKRGHFICSGHGFCECDKCVCQLGWEGDDCSCSKSQHQCINPVSQKLCSGNGKCDCNRCVCGIVQGGEKGERYTGRWCEDCMKCKGLCDNYADCVKCEVFNIGPLIDECDEACSFLTINIVSSLNESKNGKVCSYEDEEGCKIRFSYHHHVDNVVFVVKEPECPAQIVVWAIILSVVVAIILIGVAILIIWKIWVTIKDRREYEKFVTESQKATFNEEMNPLYRDPVTHVQNPMRGVES